MEAFLAGKNTRKKVKTWIFNFLHFELLRKARKGSVKWFDCLRLYTCLRICNPVVMLSNRIVQGYSIGLQRCYQRGSIWSRFELIDKDSCTSSSISSHYVVFASDINTCVHILIVRCMHILCKEFSNVFSYLSLH